MAIEDEAIIAQIGPYVVDVEPGTYFWCSCGKSGNQPFCDRSHMECNLSPMKIEITEKRTAYFCGCKQTTSPPMCDGSHQDCSPDRIGLPMSD